jgi:glycosyltransferase involved in cell wall biosynthesis
MSVRAYRQSSDANRATGILALSEAMARHVEQDYSVPRDRIRVVPNCLDPELFNRPLRPREPVVSAVGRLVVRKGLDDVARTIRERSAADPVTFEFIGAESLWSDYRRVIDDLDDPRVIRVGHLSRADTIERISRSLALIQLSRYEPFGLTVAEALAVGIPVIVTPEVGAAEGIDPRVCRFLDVPAANSGAVRARTATANDAIDELKNLPDELREVARRSARERYHPVVVVDALELALRDLLHR